MMPFLNSDSPLCLLRGKAVKFVMDGEGRLQECLVFLILCWGPVNIYPGYVKFSQ